MKKNVDLFSGIALIVGTMIGSGIFVSPTGLLERTGSITYSLLVWGLCGLVSMFGKLKLIFYRVFIRVITFFLKSLGLLMWVDVGLK